MLKYSLVLLTAVVLFSGCSVNDGICCEDKSEVVNEKGTISNPAPVAKIRLADSCIPGEVINISGADSTDNSSVALYKWTLLSISGADDTIICPKEGSQDICLIVTDDEGKDSTEICKSIIVDSPIKPACDASFMVKNDNDGNKTLASGDSFSSGDKLWLVYKGADSPAWSANSNLNPNGNCFVDDGGSRHGEGTISTTYIKTCGVGTGYTSIDVNLTVTTDDGEICKEGKTFIAK